MTWSHPRGYDPMLACAALWRRETGVAMTWDKRSLQDFESFPVEELARAYDLIVVDHPHVGQITAEGCLEPLDAPGRAAELAALAAGSVGRSWASYAWEGRQWAFPIDAAAQVQAWRPDLLAAPARTWEEVLGLAREGRMLLPLRPPHSLMVFYSLAGNLGAACAVGAPPLVDPAHGERVLALMGELAGLVPAGCFDMDPIAAFEAMAAEGSEVACVPLAYGYVPYAADGFRPHRLAFADMPGGDGPVGSALGGTGIAVSAFSAEKAAAVDFAYWIASAATQRGPYAAAGGQPGHAAAWDDEGVNAATHGFYRATRATLEAAWVRPRHDGCMAFQAAASERVNAGLRSREPAGGVVRDLDRLFAASFGGQAAGLRSTT
jgi:multiple sugar transport system substrate-binding protein